MSPVQVKEPYGNLDMVTCGLSSCNQGYGLTFFRQEQAGPLKHNYWGPSRARKLYTSARIYEWKFGKGELKLPFASPTGRVDFFGFVIIFEQKKKELTSMFYSLQKQRKHREEI